MVTSGPGARKRDSETKRQKEERRTKREQDRERHGVEEDSHQQEEDYKDKHQKGEIQEWKQRKTNWEQDREGRGKGGGRGADDSPGGGGGGGAPGLEQWRSWTLAQEVASLVPGTCAAQAKENHSQQTLPHWGAHTDHYVSGHLTSWSKPNSLWGDGKPWI